jgi:glycine betaine/proline transport system permease protein
MSEMAIARGSTDPGLIPAERAPDDLLAQFAGSDAAYLAARFERLARKQAKPWEVNWDAAVQGPIWAALRGAWVLFWVSLILDTVALMLIARALFPPPGLEAQVAIVPGLLVLILGRLAVGVMADRVYMRQFNGWRVNRSVPRGVEQRRLFKAGLLFLLVTPLLVYRATQVAPTFRECRRMWRDMGGGQAFPFADRFNCLLIGELPVDQRTLHDPIAQSIDDGVRWLVINLQWLFDAITVVVRWLLQSLETVLVGTPWPVVIALFVMLAWKLAGRNVGLFVAAGLGYLAVLGFWDKAMSTFSLVGASTVICVLLGVPIGIWCAKRARAYSFIRPALDIMQTLPSFVYLIPAIAFFGVGKPPGILATVIFALPPMVRLTVLGITQVPESVKEAAVAFGATPRQLLWKVELPLAVPSIMTGINQTIMMSLSMVVVAALIAAKGLGEDVLFALQHVEHGKGLLAGGAIALCAMMMDRVVQGTRGRN